MANNLETKERCYLVRPTEHGTYVDDKDTGRRFFRTNAGGWFWLTGPGSPLDEDTLVMGETAEFLSNLVETAHDGHQR